MFINEYVAITKEIHIQAKNIFKQFIRWCSYEIIRNLLLPADFLFQAKELTFVLMGIIISIPGIQHSQDTLCYQDEASIAFADTPGDAANKCDATVA